MQYKVKEEVAKAKQRAYIDLCVRLDNKEGENDFCRMTRKTVKDRKDMQQFGVDRDVNILTDARSIMEGQKVLWKGNEWWKWQRMRSGICDHYDAQSRED